MVGDSVANWTFSVFAHVSSPPFSEGKRAIAGRSLMAS